MKPTLSLVVMLLAGGLLASTALAQGVEKQVTLRASVKDAPRYVTTVSNGGLSLLSSTVTDRTIFTLIDLDGGELADGDKVQIKSANADGGPDTFWQETKGRIRRDRRSSTFTVKTAPSGISFQAPGGKFLASEYHADHIALTETPATTAVFEITYLKIQEVSTPRPPVPTDAVIVEERENDILIENSEIRVQFNKRHGRMTSLKRGNRELFATGSGAYLQFYAKEASTAAHVTMARTQDQKQTPAIRILRQEKGLVEVSAPSRLNGFDVDMRYVIRAGESGFYNFIVVRNDPANPPGDRILEQVNMALRANPDIFRHATIGEEKSGPLPSPSELNAAEMVMDASYKLKDGTIDAKYDWSLEETGERVFGLMGDDIGLFLVKDSGEALNSAPVARELTVHQTTSSPVMLRHFTGAHFGRGNITLTAADGPWAKLAGPWFLYVAEGKSREEIWSKARARAAQAVLEWPYAWMRDPLYPLTRGKVAGRLQIGSGGVAEGSLVFIGPAPTDAVPNWQQSGKGYFFWTRVKADGTFEIAKAREGSYSLWALNDGQFGEFRHDDVTVKAGATTQLGTLVWQPEVRGKILWQIGTPDRTAKEYRHGDDYRHWGLWLNYPKEFPRDVDFKIGQSRERADWNYVQPAVQNPDGTWRLPKWKIRFDLPAPTTGKGVLRIGVAGVSAHAGEKMAGERWAGFEVRLNGEPLQTCKYPHDGGSTRSGIGGNRYHEALVEFDAAKLQAGENVVSLTLTSVPPEGIVHNFPYCAVMYDALRLEIEAP